MKPKLTPDVVGVLQLKQKKKIIWVIKRVLQWIQIFSIYCYGGWKDKWHKAQQPRLANDVSRYFKLDGTKTSSWIVYKSLPTY